MTRSTMIRAAMLSGIAALAAGTLAVPAQAQQRYDANYAASDDGIVVAAPRVYHGDRDMATGEETLRTHERVSYADLDLNSRWGRDQLRQRVAYAADTACQRLDDESMRDGGLMSDNGDSRDCRAGARDSARGQVREAIYESGW